MIRLSNDRSVHCRMHVENRNSLLAFVGIAAILLLSLSACGSGTENQTGRADASWSQYFKSLKDLKHNSDFAVSGDITSIGAAVQPSDGGFVYSDVTLTVKRVFWSAHPSKTVPSTVLFHQNGGAYNGKTYALEDDPLYQVGQHVVLFFTEYSPGKYRVTGGPTGRFLIENNQVRPLVSNGVQLASNTDENEFAKMTSAAG